MVHLQLLLILVTSAHLLSALPLDTTFLPCYKPTTGTEVVCRNVKDFESVVEFFTINKIISIKHLLINDLILTEIPENAFRSLKCKIESLSFSRTTLQSIHPEAFKWFPFKDLLEELNIKFASKMLEVPTESLKHLPNLKILKLQNTGISYIPPNAFPNDFKKFHTLVLADNQISRMDVQSLKKLTRLDVLQLDGNPWICDEEIIPLLHELKKIYDSSLIYINDETTLCDTPAEVNGMSLLTFLEYISKFTGSPLIKTTINPFTRIKTTVTTTGTPIKITTSTEIYPNTNNPYPKPSTHISSSSTAITELSYPQSKKTEATITPVSSNTKGSPKFTSSSSLKTKSYFAYSSTYQYSFTDDFISKLTKPITSSTIDNYYTSTVNTLPNETSNPSTSYLQTSESLILKSTSNHFSKSTSELTRKSETEEQTKPITSTKNYDKSSSSYYKSSLPISFSISSFTPSKETTNLLPQSSTSGKMHGSTTKDIYEYSISLTKTTPIPDISAKTKTEVSLTSATSNSYTNVYLTSNFVSPTVLPSSSQYTAPLIDFTTVTSTKVDSSSSPIIKQSTTDLTTKESSLLSSSLSLQSKATFQTNLSTRSTNAPSESTITFTPTLATILVTQTSSNDFLDSSSTSRTDSSTHSSTKETDVQFSASTSVKQVSATADNSRKPTKHISSPNPSLQPLETSSSHSSLTPEIISKSTTKTSSPEMISKTTTKSSLPEISSTTTTKSSSPEISSKTTTKTSSPEIISKNTTKTSSPEIISKSTIKTSSPEIISKASMHSTFTSNGFTTPQLINSSPTDNKPSLTLSTFSPSDTSTDISNSKTEIDLITDFSKVTSDHSQIYSSIEIKTSSQTSIPHSKTNNPEEITTQISVSAQIYTQLLETTLNINTPKTETNLEKDNNFPWYIILIVILITIFIIVIFIFIAFFKRKSKQNAYADFDTYSTNSSHDSNPTITTDLDLDSIILDSPYNMKKSLIGKWDYHHNIN